MNDPFPQSDWRDCIKFWPYRDFTGRWQIPEYTQKRTVMMEGKLVVQYREREETWDEGSGRQW